MIVVYVGAMALLEVVAISSVAPFLALTAQPEIAESSEILQKVKSFIGTDEPRVLLLGMGFGVLTLLVLSNAFSAIGTWIAVRFAWDVNASLSHRLLSGYLSRDYLYFVSRNSSELSRNVLGEVAQISNGIIVNGYQFCSRLAVASLIVTLLFVADPKIAGIIVVTLGCCYGTIFLTLRNKLQKGAAERMETGAQRYRLVGEVFAGIKEVKCFGTERYFLSRFSEASKRFGRSQSSSTVIARIPSYFLEMLGFGAIIGMVVSFIWVGRDMEEFLPVAGLYVFAGYRLLPAMQQGYGGLVSMRYSLSALDAVYDDLEGFSSMPDEAIPSDASDEEALRMGGEFVAENVSFRYPNSEKDALEGINMRIANRTTVGIAGSTGAGKTTLVDLILGLVEPDSGELRVDGTVIDAENRRAWQRNIGYVAQSIFLTDDSIARNIAFGLPEEKIDYEMVKTVAQVAHLDEFVGGLPKGYDTVVGERGMRLSGGQRQRIGIARALYHNPEVLILDEATSALDNVTEGIVMEMIATLGGKKTIVIIAHRISTIESCDEIFVMKGGRIAAQGSYQKLVEQSSLFRELAAEVGSR